MHEFSLMQTLLDIVKEQASHYGAHSIHRIILQVGPLSGAVPESLQFAFEILKQNTIAWESKLEIRSTPVQCYCPFCDRYFRPNRWIYECENCGQISTDIRAGKELELVSLEMS